jgi:hypothetical protein
VSYSSIGLFHGSDDKDELRSLQTREYATYKRWMAIITEMDRKLSDVPALTYIAGRQVTLLSSKLAQKYNAVNGLVLSIVTDAEALNTHARLIKSRNLVNNLLCFSTVSRSYFTFNSAR